MRLDKAIFLADLPQSESFGLIPDGWYPAIVKEATLSNTKDGTGKYITINFQILEGEYNGRRVYSEIINIVNKNPVAEDIARKTLAQIMTAVGLATIADTDDLINAPMDIFVSTKKSDQFGDKNQATKFRQINDQIQVEAPKPIDFPKAASIPNPYAQKPAQPLVPTWAARKA